MNERDKRISSTKYLNTLDATIETAQASIAEALAGVEEHTAKIAGFEEDKTSIAIKALRDKDPTAQATYDGLVRDLAKSEDLVSAFELQERKSRAALTDALTEREDVASNLAGRKVKNTAKKLVKQRDQILEQLVTLTEDVLKLKLACGEANKLALDYSVASAGEDWSVQFMFHEKFIKAWTQYLLGFTAKLQIDVDTSAKGGQQFRPAVVALLEDSSISGTLAKLNQVPLRKAQRDKIEGI